MTLNGYDLSYEKGIVNISEDFGPQFIDIVNVVITSQNGESFTADSLLLRAKGTLEKLDWIDQVEVVNTKLVTTLNSGSQVLPEVNETMSAIVQRIVSSTKKKLVPTNSTINFMKKSTPYKLKPHQISGLRWLLKMEKHSQKVLINKLHLRLIL